VAIKRILSADNTFQHAEVLKRNRQKRAQYKEFFVEGVKNINQAIGNGWKISSFFIEDRRELSSWAKDIIRSVPADGNYALAPELFARLSEKEDPSEILALVKMRGMDLSAIPFEGKSCVILCDRPSSPGNLGSLVRSADAFAAGGVIVTGHAADIFDPKTIRASMGSFFAVPIVQVESLDTLRLWAERFDDIVFAAAVEDGDIEAADFTFDKPTLVCLGNEAQGLSRAILEMCSAKIRISMTGTASSLNVSSAGSIILYRAYMSLASKIRGQASN